MNKVTALIAALFAMLLILLAAASGDTPLFAGHYPLLIGFNALAALLLVLLVILRMRRLWREYRRGVFGSRLKMRLLVMLTLMAVVPGALIYSVSMRFSDHVDSWFDVRIENALEGGLELGRGMLDVQKNDLLERARQLALELSYGDTLTLDRLREQSGADTATLITVSGRVLTHSSDLLNHLLPDLPPLSQLRLAAGNRMGIAAVEGDPALGLTVRVLVPVISGTAFGIEPRILQLTRPVAVTFTKSAAAVESAYRDYQEIQVSREGLKRIYSLTLTFTLLLALFAAIALAFSLAERLARPLLMLAEGTRAVAAGDLAPRAVLETHDELGVLTRSFNDMTAQIAQARIEREAAQRAAMWTEVAKRLAHEIKNPLTPIQLSAERLLHKLSDKLDPEDQAMLERAVGTIVNQVDALKSMVNEFRDYARLPAPMLAPVDINALIRDVLELYKPDDVTITAALSENLPTVTVDAHQIRQVLNNLLKNALESPAQTLQLSTRQEGQSLVVSVTDNGPGFPPHILERAFEPYVTHKAKGTGLGLAIVKKIIMDHHGEISLANREEGGACITFKLPIVITEATLEETL